MKITDLLLTAIEKNVDIGRLRFALKMDNAKLFMDIVKCLPSSSFATDIQDEADLLERVEGKVISSGQKSVAVVEFPDGTRIRLKLPRNIKIKAGTNLTFEIIFTPEKTSADKVSYQPEAIYVTIDRHVEDANKPVSLNSVSPTSSQIARESLEENKFIDEIKMFMKDIVNGKFVKDVSLDKVVHFIRKAIPDWQDQPMKLKRSLVQFLLLPTSKAVSTSQKSFSLKMLPFIEDEVISHSVLKEEIGKIIALSVFQHSKGAVMKDNVIRNENDKLSNLVERLKQLVQAIKAKQNASVFPAKRENVIKDIENLQKKLQGLLLNDDIVEMHLEKNLRSDNTSFDKFLTRFVDKLTDGNWNYIFVPFQIDDKIKGQFQIGVERRRKRTKGKNSRIMTMLNLDLINLGEMQVSAIYSDKTLSLNFLTERENIRRYISDIMPELIGRLKDDGVRVNSISIGVKQKVEFLIPLNFIDMMIEEGKRIDELA